MQKNYPQYFDLSRAGFLSGLGVPRVRAYKNSADTKADSYTFAIPATPADNTVYSITDAAGRTASYTTGTSTPRATLGAGILDAVRQSDLYDVATPSLAANVLTMTARSAIDPLVLTAAGFATPTAINTGAAPVAVPFGTFVARKSTDLADEARIPSASSDKILGVAISTYAIEKDAKGTAAKVAYQPNEAMDILDRCNQLDGVWVACLEADIAMSDTLYVGYSGANQGLLTKTSTNAIALSNAALVKGTVTNSDGTRMALLSLNFF